MEEKYITGASGRRLGDFLDTVEDRTIKIGARNGTAFFYVGKAGDFIKKGSEYSAGIYNDVCKTISDIETYFLTTYEKDYSDNRTIAEKLIVAYDQIKEAVPEVVVGNEAKLKYAFPKNMEVFVNSVKSKINTLVFNRKYKAAWVELLDRTVDEVFYADEAVDKDCIVVMVDGNENGYFWTTDEAKHSNWSFTGFTKTTIEFTTPEV